MNLDQMREEVSGIEADLRRLKARIATVKTEQHELETRLRHELEPQMREVVAFARDRGHTWLEGRASIGLPEDHNDEQLVQWLVEVFSTSEVHDHGNEIDSIEREIREMRSDLKKSKNLLEFFS